MSNRKFVKRVGIVLGLFTLAVVVLFVLWQAATVFLLAFAGLLFAAVIDGIREPLERYLRVPERLSMPIVLLLLAALLVGGSLYMGPRLGAQLGELASAVPPVLSDLREQASANPIGEWVLDRLPMPPTGDGADASAEPSGTADLSIVGQLRSVFGGVLGAFAGLFFVLFAGIFLAANPSSYRDGVIHLFPRASQAKAREVANTLGATLRGWLVGQLISMVVVGVLSGIALWILDVPLVLALAFLAFLFEFIPTVGPWLAGIPAVTLAFADGPDKALWVVVAYFVIQMAEGNIIHPLAQRRAVDLPPFVTIVAIFLMERLFGFPGVLVASPLAAVILVLVRELWMRDQLGEDVNLPGEQEGEGTAPA